MRPARIGHRFEQVGKAMQGGFGKPDLGLLTTSGREDTLACDTIHGRLSLRKDLDCYRYLISREKPLSAIIHKPCSLLPPERLVCYNRHAGGSQGCMSNK